VGLFVRPAPEAIMSVTLIYIAIFALALACGVLFRRAS
jgi:hypothetical protein